MITIEREIALTAGEMAEGFWDIDCGEQARFFNALGKIMQEDESAGILQLDYMFMCQELNEDGLWLLRNLAIRTGL